MTDENRIENRPWQQQEKNNGKDIKKPWTDPEPEVIIVPSNIVPTVLPEGEKTTFFQEHQFDEDLKRHKSGPAPDPEDGFNMRDTNTFSQAKAEHRARRGNVGLRKLKKKRIEEATQVLASHPNKVAILKILRSE
jgi:hypothetical protein